MILAAGLGTRLRPLTDDRPKALVEVGGRTLLEITLCRLRSFGVDEVIVNAHHFSAMIVEFLKDHHNFDLKVEVSLEEDLLDTGGGLKKAAHFFSGSDEPFLLHNVDVLSTIDLRRMVRFHQESNALATLAVQQRASSRQLLFDQSGQLCGRRSGSAEERFDPRSQNRDRGHPHLPISQNQDRGHPHLPRSQSRDLGHPDIEPLAFSGIHVLSPRIFSMLEEEGAFSIVPAYLRLAAQGEKILAFRADESYWRDLGRPESLRQAEAEIAGGRTSSRIS
jgi:NDP-sugar pyrophosphorylase family protein